MKRNLLYNCCPLAVAPEVWRDNVETLCSYGDAFNARKLVILRTGEGMEPAPVVEAAFSSLRNVEFLHLPNDPVLHETAGFAYALGHLASLDPRELTFYAHTKGVRPELHEGELRVVSIRQWRNRMYYECLRDVPRLEHVMQTHSAAGCYAMPEGERKRAWTQWMFAGTFYWLKHSAVFSDPGWRFLGPDPDWFAVENYPGAHIPRVMAHSFVPHVRGHNKYVEGVGIYRCPQCGLECRRRMRSEATCCGPELELRSTPDLIFWEATDG